MVSENDESNVFLGSYNPPGSSTSYRLYLHKGDPTSENPIELLAYWGVSNLARFSEATATGESATALYVAYLLNGARQVRDEDPLWDNYIGRYRQEYWKLLSNS